MTDWQPGDPLFARPVTDWGSNPMFEVKEDYDGPEPASMAASWPTPKPQRDLGMYP
jgi:hypothetical protein